MKQHDHIHIRGEIKTVHWSPEGLPDFLVLDTNSRVEIPIDSLIDPDAIAEGATVEVDGETNLRSMTGTIHHAQVMVDGKVVADDTRPAGQKGSKRSQAATVKTIGHVQSIAFQLGGAIDHLVLDNGTIVRVDPCCNVSDDLSIGDSIQVIGHAVNPNSKSVLQAESITFVKNCLS